MNIYKCETCNKLYNDKTKYTKHINKKIPCCPIFKDYENQKKRYYLETEYLRRTENCNVDDLNNQESDDLNNQETDDKMANNQSLENTDENATNIDKVKVLSDLIDYLYNNREAIIKTYKEKKELNKKINKE
jgi:hypothetical protein